LGSFPDGLSQTEAEKRLTQYGPNEIEKKNTDELLKFLSYFWSPTPWMIEAAVILSAIAGIGRALASSAFCFWPNAVVGFREEHQAGDAIAALKATMAIKARVNSDRKCITRAARELVSWCRATSSSACVWATSCRRGNIFWFDRSSE
jgi:H+-transporting ATPase